MDADSNNSETNPGSNDGGASAAVPSARPFWIKSVTFSDGTDFPVPSAGIVVFVGPNNVGKSQALRDVYFHLTGERRPGIQDGHRVVTGIGTEWCSAETDPLEWLNENAKMRSLGGGAQHYVRQGVYRQRAAVEREIAERAEGVPRTIGALSSLLADAETRLANSNPAEALQETDVPQSPIHLLDDPKVAEQLSEASRQAFGQPLTLDRLHRQWLFRFGRPTSDPGSGPHGLPSLEFRRELADLTTLADQGHGLRSYVSLLLELTVSGHLFVLVDEPEAFLHPPQARSLARQIIELKSAQSQVFVATHDSNIVRGLLEAASEDGLTIVRIQRSGERNPVAILGNQDVKRLWDNPSLRYSNALDGLFHTGVVVCESDGDCRLYESVMDELDSDGAPDLLFTHGGGIARVPTLVSAFKSVGTPTAAIVDIDILQEDTRLEGIVSALRIHWDPIWDGQLATIRNAANQRSTLPPIGSAKRDIAKAFGDSSENDPLDTETQTKIRAAVKGATGWAIMKKAGSALLSGDAFTAWENLAERFAAAGLFIVPGELESWFPEVSGHGPSYVSDVHEAGLHRDPEKARDIRRFCERVRDFLVTVSPPADAAE